MLKSKRKSKQAYEDKNDVPLSRSMLNAIVHRDCYAKHHFRYGYSLNRKRPSRKASNRPFPFCNVTNNQDLTSRFTGIVSTGYHPKEKSVLDLDFGIESTSNSWSTTSFLTNPNKTVIFHFHNLLVHALRIYRKLIVSVFQLADKIYEAARLKFSSRF